MELGVPFGLPAAPKTPVRDDPSPDVGTDELGSKGPAVWWLPRPMPNELVVVALKPNNLVKSC